MSKTPINKLPLIIISAILLGAILPMTVRGNSDAGTPAASGDSLSYNDRRRYDYFFIEAIRKQNAGDYAAAFDLLNHCLEIKPDAAEAYYARASYFSEMQNDSLALRDIEKAIMDSDVGITPENNGEIIRLAIPQPTEERRRELVKQCNKIGEKTKVEVRNARAETKEKLKKAIKDGLSEDNEKDAELELQKIHDKYIKKIDDLLDEKTKEIMTV